MRVIKIVRYGGWTVLGIAAALASGLSLMMLAEQAGGWPRGTEILLPISIDVFAVLSIIEWRTSSTAEARRLAKRKAWGAIALSGVGNAISHLVAAGVIPVHWTLTAAVGSIPAIALGLSVHTALEPLRAAESLVVEPVSQSTDREPPASEALTELPGSNAPTELPPELEQPADAPTLDTPDAELETVVKNMRQHDKQHGKPPSRTHYREHIGKVSNETFAAARRVLQNGHSTQH